MKKIGLNTLKDKLSEATGLPANSITVLTNPLNIIMPNHLYRYKKQVIDPETTDVIESDGLVHLAYSLDRMQSNRILREKGYEVPEDPNDLLKFRQQLEVLHNATIVNDSNGRGNKLSIENPEHEKDLIKYSISGLDLNQFPQLNQEPQIDDEETR